jgi:uncharacterized protein (UPF0548 family)
MARAWNCKWHTEFVFTLRPTAAAEIEKQIAAVAGLPPATLRMLSLGGGLAATTSLPFGFAHDFSRSRIGSGEAAYAAAKLAFQRWAMFDLGWVRVANPDASIEPDQTVAVEVQALGLWSLNLSGIRKIVDTPTRFGFIYATTEMHVEQGEELFLLEFDPSSGDLFYRLEAVSRPRNLLAWLGFPVTRSFQRRFAHDSHRRMKEGVPAW